MRSAARRFDQSAELLRFSEFVAEKAQQNLSISPEELLSLWREKVPAEVEQDGADEDDLSAIKSALEDFDRGDRGISLSEFSREIDRKFGLASR